MGLFDEFKRLAHPYEDEEPDDDFDGFDDFDAPAHGQSAGSGPSGWSGPPGTVSYTHLRAHETITDLGCRYEP